MSNDRIIAIRERINECKAAIANQSRLERMKALEIQEHIRIQAALYDEQTGLEIQLAVLRDAETVRRSEPVQAKKFLGIF